MSAGDRTRSHDVPVLGTHLHVEETGAGPPVLLLHGNPTSSYLWRHVLRSGVDGRRLVAPDLVGMGRSGRPDIAYRLVDHVDHVEALTEAMGLQSYVVVGHDWGGPIAVELLRRHTERVVGLAVMETRLRSLPSWEDFDDGRDLFRRLRTPGVGEQMVLHENFFVELLLPAALGPDADRADLAAYAAPYPDAESRRPLLAWAREIPVAGEPADVVALVDAGTRALVASEVPVLLVHGGSGVVLGPADVAWCRVHLRHLTVVDVGPAGHFLPEDRPEEVVSALRS